MRVVRGAQVVALLLAVALVFGGGPAAGAQVPAAEDGFVALIGQERQSRGLPDYTRAPDLVEVARAHAQRMAASGQPYHNPNLGGEVQNWLTVGENVGMGYDVNGLHELFMASATHRANILATDYTEVGVGVVTTADGRMWVVVLFRLPYGPSAPPVPPPATPIERISTTPPPAPEPEPEVAPPTTEAATTATAPPDTAPPPPDTTAPAPSGAEVLAATAPADAEATVLVEGTPIAVQLPAPVRDIPPQAWGAALLINLVVALQCLAVRRLRLAPAAG